MKENRNEIRYLDELVERYPVLGSIREDILGAYEMIKDSYEAGGKLLAAGNGGSCADSEHIVGELMKGFVKRRPVPAAFAEALKEADGRRGEELAKMPAAGASGHSPDRTYRPVNRNF